MVLKIMEEIRIKGLELTLDLLLEKSSELVCDFSSDGRKGFYALMGAVSWVLEEYSSLTNSVPLLQVEF
jgi:hypothetical protein